MKKREIVLKPEEVKGIISQAYKRSLRDYLLLKTMTVLDLRVGEVVGSDGRRRENGKWVPCEANVPGLLIQDLKEDGIWVQRKGAHRTKSSSPPAFLPMTPNHVKEVKEFIGKRKEGRIFELSIGRVEQLTRFYAQMAGVTDWKMVHPHRFRHYTTTQVARKYGVIAARDIAGHTNVSTTNRYIAELPDEEKRKIIQAQADLISV